MTEPYLDTSALAKWYLNEPYSEAVEDYLRSLSYGWVSGLTALELRCLLARRRRAREISAELESQVMAVFEQDIVAGHLRLVALEGADPERAVRIVTSLPAQALRTLDALHLSIVQSRGIESLATADRVMAAAATAMGLVVTGFFPNGPGVTAGP